LRTFAAGLGAGSLLVAAIRIRDTSRQVDARAVQCISRELDIVEKSGGLISKNGAPVVAERLMW